MEGSTLDLSPLTLEDVGDMAEVKAALTEAVLWPLDYPDTFARLGVAAPRGLLLYGPPGCGKTFLVKAIAGSGKANVLSVKGAELLSKWVGESERAVRELFRRARESSPAIVFLDEVDALAPVRGQSTDGGTTDRVVASLLTELDGVEDLRDVVVIGATNRPDLVDPAMLRPGRLERLVFVPPPDAEARAAVLRSAAKGVPSPTTSTSTSSAGAPSASRPPTAPRSCARRPSPPCASRCRRRRSRPPTSRRRWGGCGRRSTRRRWPPSRRTPTAAPPGSRAPRAVLSVSTAPGCCGHRPVRDLLGAQRVRGGTWPTRRTVSGS
jgi:hypothetical protein